MGKVLVGVFAVVLMGLLLQYQNCVTPLNGTVNAASTSTYATTVENDSPTSYWQLADSVGISPASSIGLNSVAIDGSVILGVTGPFTINTAVTGAAFDGGYLTTTNSISNPENFSLEAWFKTSSTTGGTIFSFGQAQIPSQTTGDRDRLVFMENSGQIIFSVYNGSHTNISTTSAYNDGAWHHVVATIGSTGTSLYVDGTLAASGTATSAQNYTGYWSIGYQNLSGWTSAATQYYFQGTLAQVAIYSYQLTATQVMNHFTVGKQD